MRKLIHFSMTLALLACTVLPAAAQEDIGPRMGVIPGTTMSRDEFRARAEAQLSAIALNALTDRLINDRYNVDFYDLQASPAWNLAVKNIFTGRPVQAVYFEPRPEMMTSVPPVGLGGLDPGTPTLPAPPQGVQPGPQQPGELPKLELNITTSRPLRVDPSAVRGAEGGDVLYYAKDDLLQLVMYAPDGTYFEWVDEVPNPNFREALLMSEGAPDQQLFSAQVLYFIQNQAPKYYNLVQYMADKPTLPGAQLPTVSAQQRIDFAKALGITVRNPHTRQPISVAADCARGDLMDNGGGSISICTDEGPKTMDDLTSDIPQQRQPQQTQPKQQQQQRPGTRPAPPGGGRGSPAPPGGGRR